MYYHRPRCNKDPTLFSLMMRHFLDQGKIAHAWVVHCDYCHYYYEAATPEDRRLLPMRDWWLEFAQEAVLQDFANGIAFSHVPFILPILKFRDLEMVDFAEQSLKSRVGIVPGNLEHYKNVWELCKVGKYQEAMAGSTSDAEGRSEGERNTGIDFVTLVLCMSAAARSNDLGTTLSLFNTAKNCGWHQSPLTLRPIIQVLGGHNLLKEAEIMCSTFFSTQRKRGPAKDDSFDSLVPNTMLDVYCEKGELAAAERLFNEMRRRGIPCDRQTWHHLARTFCRVRQVARAEALVMADSKCQRDPVIFEILMGGALLMHQFRRVHAYATKMKRRGLPLSIKAYSMMARATLAIIE
jgi:pentatricopeptide repeat protein